MYLYIVSIRHCLVASLPAIFALLLLLTKQRIYCSDNKVVVGFFVCFQLLQEIYLWHYYYGLVYVQQSLGNWTQVRWFILYWTKLIGIISWSGSRILVFSFLYIEFIFGMENICGENIFSHPNGLP